MRIEWRPSGGRGEYEITGEGTPAQDLYERTLWLDFGALRERDTQLKISSQGKKLRLRRKHSNVHQIQRQVASALLLPPSRRSIDGLASGPIIAISSQYIIRSILLEDVVLDPSSGETNETSLSVLRARIRKVRIENYTATEDIDVPDRAIKVEELHARRDRFSDSVAQRLKEHLEALQDEPYVVSPEVERCQKRLMETLESQHPIQYIAHTDPVPSLRSFIHADSPTPPESVTSDDIAAISDPEIRLARTRVLRTQRSASATQFRIRVMKAYNSTCVFCGIRLPRKKNRLKAGCQAAHILPYAVYDADVVSNGLCLCPTHHWAFDEHMLLVKATRVRSGAYLYSVEVSERARRLLPPESAQRLRQVAGAIPEERLPSRRDDRPNPDWLAILYQDINME